MVKQCTSEPVQFKFPLFSPVHLKTAFAAKAVILSIALILSGCQPYPTPMPSLPAAAVVTSVEKVAEKVFRIKLKGPATTLDFISWKTEVIAMCHGWMYPYFFSVNLEKVSEDSVWFICKALKMTRPSLEPKLPEGA